MHACLLRQSEHHCTLIHDAGRYNEAAKGRCLKLHLTDGEGGAASRSCLLVAV